MGPVNKEYLEPDELRRQASSLRAAARKPSLMQFAGDLLARARGVDATLQRQIDAEDAAETADYLERIRSYKTATSSDPYGEGAHA